MAAKKSNRHSKPGKSSPPRVVSTPAKVRPSKMSRRRALVLVGVHLAVVAHLVHWRLTGSTVTPVEPSEAMEFSKHGVINAGLVFFAASILSTALFGRFFCGWGCHLVMLQDLAGWLLGKLGIRPRPLRSRLLLWVPMAAFVYMFLWPAIYRLVVGRPWEQGVTSAFTTTDFWATFPGLVVALLTFGVCGFAIVYFLGAKGFCTYACPYGAAFGVADRLAPAAIRVTDACGSCGHCTAVCTSNVRVHQEVRDYGMVVDPGCMKCMDCVSVCPHDALYFGLGRPALLVKPRVKKPATARRQLSFGEELLIAGAFIVAFFSFRGLYGLLPFLFSLGWAAIVAYLVLLGARLIYRPNLRLRTLRLKRGGSLVRAGWGFALALIALVGLCGHSAWIQLEDLRGRRAFDATDAFRGRVLQPTPRITLDLPQRAVVDAAILHLGRVDRWGLVEMPRLVAQLAWMRQLADDGEGFRATVERALHSDPENAILHLLVGRDLASRQRFSAAEDAYGKALEFSPTMINAYLGLGILHASRGQMMQAGRVFERGLERAPESAELHFNRALVRAYSGNVEGAREGFEQVLDLSSDHLPARENLAGLLASTGQYEAALAHYQVAIRQSPSDPSTRLLMAQVYLALNRLQPATQQLNQALALDPMLAPARELQALVEQRRRSGGQSGD